MQFVYISMCVCLQIFEEFSAILSRLLLSTLLNRLLMSASLVGFVLHGALQCGIVRGKYALILCQH